MAAGEDYSGATAPSLCGASQKLETGTCRKITDEFIMLYMELEVSLQIPGWVYPVLVAARKGLEC